jgi:glycosyltransferase involved in cell wall biosynthesis
VRICHVAYTFYETDNRVMRYARDMARDGHEVDVIALRRPRQRIVEYVDGVRLLRIQRRSVTERTPAAYLLKLLWFLLKSTALLACLQLKHRYRVVHVHNIPDFLVFAAIVPKLTGAKVVLDIHDIVPELYAGKFCGNHHSPTVRALLAIERASCSFADHVIVANDLWHDTLLRRSAKRCTSILNYPDTALFKPIQTQARQPGDRFVFLYPGTLNHHQGVDLAVRALSLVRDDMPDADLHIYGDGPAKPSLEKLVADLRLGGRVRLRDRVSIVEIAPILATADVGLVPKRADGFGNEAFSTKILEFMISGVPVIVSRTRVDEHYFDSTLVRFFEAGDERDLAAAMLDTRRHMDAAIARAGNARQFAVRNSWQRRGQEYHRLIDSLVGVTSHERPPRLDPI